jgi:hypothetical protein
MLALTSSTTMAFAPMMSRVATPRATVSMAAADNTAVSKKSEEFCYGLPGAIAPAGEWDPAGILVDLKKSEVYRLREAEITHGRVGMLAAAGFLVQENFHPLFSGDGGPAIQQIPALPVPLWFGMTLAIGIAESVRIQKGWANPYEGMDNVQALKEGYYPGDLGFDPLGLKPEDPAEFRTMQEKELSHGRLGMLAAAGFMAQEAVTGATWGELDLKFEDVLLGGWFAKEAIDTAM